MAEHKLIEKARGILRRLDPKRAYKKGRITCPVCNGEGTLPNPYKVPYPWQCWRCGGSGFLGESTSQGGENKR